MAKDTKVHIEHVVLDNGTHYLKAVSGSHAHRGETAPYQHLASVETVDGIYIAGTDYYAGDPVHGINKLERYQ